MSHPELAAGVIHDIGYRRYDGPRLGRRHAVLALYVHSLRGVFGLGRPARAKVVPFLLLGLMCAPALVSAAVTATTPVRPIAYTQYAYFLQLVVIVFLAAQAAQAVSADLRFRVVALYGSRPLARGDYVWAKLAALASATLILLATPMLIMFAAVLLAHTHTLSDAADETRRVVVGLAGASGYAVLLAALAGAICAATRVRAFAIVAIVGAYLVTSSVVAIVQGVTRGSDTATLFGLLTPFTLLDGLQAWALRVPPTVPPGPGQLGWAYALTAAASLAAALGWLHWRYRRLEA